MIRSGTFIACAAMLAAGAAYADCQSELSALEGGVSKDGTMAPLGTPGDATPQVAPTHGGGTGDQATGDGLAKDGTTEPLGASPEVATSGQDAQAQQEGGKTAAQQAQGAAGTPDARMAALDRAKVALAQGDEDACMKAVEEAKGS